MKSLTREQLHALVTVAEKHSPQDALMLKVIFNHGLRIGEVTGGRKHPGLTAANIVSGHLVIAREKGSRRTTQPLLDDERDGLERLATTRVGRLFPMSRATAWRRIQAYGREAGIPITLCHPHVLRHSTGRLGYLGGMSIPDVVSYLGHVNPANSLIYMQSSEGEACTAFATAKAGL